MVTDSATNEATSASVNVRVDNTAPFVAIGGIANGQNVSGSIGLSATATDVGGSGILSVQYGYRTQGSVGGYTTIGSSSTPSSYGVTLNTLSPLVADGLYQIRAVATDLANHTQESSVTSVRVDNTDPGTPLTPTGLTPVSASPTIGFTAATDGGSGIAHYDVYRDGTPVGPQVPVGSGGPYTWSDTGLSAAGSYDYTVVAVDAAGNESSASGALTIYLDPSGQSTPTSVAALANPTSQRPQISWGAPVFFAVDHYSVYRGGSFVMDTTATTFTDLTAGDGSHTYQVVAKDSSNVAGIASAPVTILFDTAAPDGAGSRPGDCRARRLGRHRLGGRERRGRLGRDALRRPQVAVLDAPGLGGRR